ncbi:protein arginine kinase [Clostridium botulinum]|uniref:Protein arginine kinase n=1 Tax=Clostridium botulinum TaxID=1491 RepID=A0A6B4JQ42_CLOBO|nr:protein arginine kinase [Clostridium botulinum]EES48106.1 putative ATP:guanido phosphotransferase [Clostridium botulinum E1 str. 'BoNT E Beluga']MBY6762445.1 protein arginine kinase [Clostridium botulinum]MBY6921105.1 protein arginine kinase [Clostridium botulinum]MCR1132876.1 protein arginine kinase [Clostridium botulinum]NFH69483.1 protein arginine kinase [Clostridium botulinum]
MKNWINEECNKEDIVINSNISLSRNLKEKPFSNKLNEIEARENAGFIYQIVKNELGEESCVYQLWNEDKELINSYLDKQLISKELIKNKDKTAFVLNNEQTLSVMINEDDHLKLKCITAGFDLETAFDNITKIDDKIEKRVHYAFDENLGYLTTSPTNLGTGMRASVNIHLPALNFNDEINNFSKGLTQIGMDMKAIYEEGNKAYGNMYKISNQVTLGLTEEEIIDNLKGAVLNVISEEKKFREVLLTKCKYDIEDKVFRAYGILTSAILLSEKECTELLSSVRFGVELSLLDIPKNKLNKLLVYTRDSSLQNYLKRKLSNKELNYERAKFVRSILA